MEKHTQPTNAASPLSADQNGLIEEAYQKSLDLLRRNCTRHGIIAAPDDLQYNYNAIWGRDGSICAAAAFLSDDPEVEENGIKTLRTLADHQGANGQIPSYLKVDKDGNIREIVYGGLGNVTSIDSNLWFLIAAYTAFRDYDRQEFVEDKLFNVYSAALRHLQSIDSDCCGLLEIPAAGDWSDILDRSYHVLYDQVLWYRAVNCTARLFEERDDKETCRQLRSRARTIHERLNSEFWWDREAIELARNNYFIRNPIPDDKEFPYYQSYLQPFDNRWFHRFDSFGNVLACLMGVAPQERCRTIIQRVFDHQLNQPHPLRVLDPPVSPGDDDWYKIYKSKEQPYDYHNGGIWPLAGGFWVVLLAAVGQTNQALQELVRLAGTMRVGKEDEDPWQFYEYFHGKTGEPKGRPQQSWNAAAFIFAYKAVRENRLPCLASVSGEAES